MLDVSTEKLLKFNAEGIHPAKQYLDAREQAVKAVEKYMDGKEEAMYCGFANVSVNPARGKFVSFLKKAGVGDNGWNGEYRHTQSMDIKEVACDAFANALKKYGLTVYSESRAD
jgi:hypothetical protein